MAEYQGLNLITKVFFGTGAAYFLSITCSALYPSSPDYNFFYKKYTDTKTDHIHI